MSHPLITLDRAFSGSALPALIGNLVKSSPDGQLPKEVHFDFSRLDFIQPEGVVFLSNLCFWLHHKSSKVVFENIEGGGRALRYLDDSLFFEQHLGSKIYPTSAVRVTTQPLNFISQGAIHAWLEFTLIPWLAGCLGKTSASLYTLQNSISEIFNNIKDHTTLDIGSIFTQHFPNKNRVVIAVSDFGRGIPASVRTLYPDVSDADAIVMAVQDGFTTRSISTNFGRGLDTVMKMAVLANGGAVTIYSLKSIVTFNRNGTDIVPSVWGTAGFCPGTTIQISLRTDAIENIPVATEDFSW
jgi:hypothetical protein